MPNFYKDEIYYFLKLARIKGINLYNIKYILIKFNNNAKNAYFYIKKNLKFYQKNEKIIIPSSNEIFNEIENMNQRQQPVTPEAPAPSTP